jgi:hypothetical protein
MSPLFLLRYSKMKKRINTASIGHDIVAILDGDVSNPFVLNDYYQTKLDDFTRNTSISFEKLSSWTAYNNIQSMGRLQQSNYRRDSIYCCRRHNIDSCIELSKPFVNYTEFYNRPFEP